MNPGRWNKLMRRALRCYERLPRPKRYAMRRRWVQWAEQVTGTTCFWGIYARCAQGGER